MIAPRPPGRRFAQAAAWDRTPFDDDERGLPVAQRILMRLHERLGKVIGPVGFDTLLARALVLARRAHPALDGITTGPGGKLEGLAERSRAGTGFDEDALPIVSHFVRLLMNLIGEDLAIRMIGDIWPVTFGDEER